MIINYGGNFAEVKLHHFVGMDLPDMLLEIPLVFCLQVAVGTMVDDVVVLCLDVLLDIPDLGVLVVAEVALVPHPLVLAADVPLEGALVDGHEVAEVTGEPHAPVHRLDVPEEGPLAPGHVGALATGYRGIGVSVRRRSWTAGALSSRLAGWTLRGCSAFQKLKQCRRGSHVQN